jgi:DNA-directed RNA polymerase specialized sigma24 family protein
MEETVQSLYETNQLRYFVARVVTNQVLSTSSPFHNTYRLREPKNPLISSEYDYTADVVWLKALNLSNDMAKNIVYLKYEYGLKIREIAKIKGVSTRYVHKVLAKTLKDLKDSL